MNFTKPLFLLFILLFSFQINAQEKKLISEKKLLKDFSLLTSYVEAHPKPYRHISEKEFKALVKKTKKSIVAPMSDLDFYKLVSPIYAVIKDGHTSMNMPFSILKKYYKKNGVFPYEVYLTDENQLYIIDNYGTDSTIALGAEILALNDVPVADFIKNIDPYISYEQEIFRNVIIEKRFNFYLLLHFGEITEIKVDYLSDKKRSHIVSYISNSKMEKEEYEREKEKEMRLNSGQPYAYEKIKDGVGILKIYSFAVRSMDKYGDFLRRTFKQIKKDGITSLLIDVRGNTGGYPKVSSELLHYVSEKNFKTMAKAETKVSQAYKDYFNQMVGGRDIGSSSMQFLSGRHSIDVNTIFSKENGEMIVEDAKFNEAPEEQLNEFTGDLYLLTDRQSFSASSSFAATFRCYQLGVIIGSETGGTKVFHANSMWQQLPASNINCAMATCRDYTTCFYEEDEGIQPDLEVKPQVFELVAKMDPVVNYTMRVIKKVEKMRSE